MYDILQFMEYTIYSSELVVYLLLWYLRSHLEYDLFQVWRTCMDNSVKYTPWLSKLSEVCSDNSDMLNFTTLKSSLQQLRYTHTDNSNEPTDTTPTL